VNGLSFGQGRYRVKERIGAGGMAEVFLALATGAAGFEREVVVKRMLPNVAAEPTLVQAFLDEARLVARLNHPHVAQVFDLGESPEGPFLVMEYVDGRDLRGVMEKARGPLPPGIAAMIVRDVCEALDHGFSWCDDEGVPLKLVHRDVSLSNVMVSMSGVVKLVDFGLAKALTNYERRHTAGGIIKGKYSYMAPEVLRGAPADHKSDIFSAGVVLFETLCGRKLYKPTNSIVDMLAERETAPPAPSSIASKVPRELDIIVGRALSRDPARRYTTAEEMAAALDEVVHRFKARPSGLAEQMANLFDPDRLRATRSMSATEHSSPGEPSGVDGPDTDPHGIDAPPTEASGTPIEILLDKEPSGPSALDAPPTQVTPQLGPPGIDNASTAIKPMPRKTEQPPTVVKLRSGTHPAYEKGSATTVVRPKSGGATLTNPWYLAAAIGGLVIATAAALVLIFR
jgi:serine/threonine-protein kinase